MTISSCNWLSSFQGSVTRHYDYESMMFDTKIKISDYILLIKTKYTNLLVDLINDVTIELSLLRYS